MGSLLHLTENDGRSPVMNKGAQLADRLRGAVWGQFVGDAAALGTHWIYDLEDLAAKFPTGVQGFEAPLPGHYHEGKRSGDFTHYGDAALLLLESVANQGRFDEIDFGQRFVKFFSDPGCPSYKDHATKETLTNLLAQPGNYQNGAADDQPGAASRLAPVIVAHFREKDDAFFDMVLRATRFSHNDPVAFECSKAHAIILQALFGGADFSTALEQARRESVNCDTADYIESALSLQNLDVVEATEHFGQSCPLPNSFPASVHAALAHKDNFKEAILATLRAGGDNAARACLIGSWLGALHGIDGIPQEWRDRLSAKARIEDAVETLIRRSGL